MRRKDHRLRFARRYLHCTAGGGEAKRIIGGFSFESQPRLSPDGKKIVFVSDRSGAENLWIARCGRLKPEGAYQGRNASVPVAVVDRRWQLHHRVQSNRRSRDFLPVDVSQGRRQRRPPRRTRTTAAATRSGSASGTVAATSTAPSLLQTGDSSTSRSALELSTITLNFRSGRSCGSIGRPARLPP